MQISEEHIRLILGPFISIMLFMIAYRKSIGAKKERIKAANIDLEKILLRRIILDDFTPSISDVVNLIEGKSRDYNVKTSDMYSEGQLLNCIYTRLMETDYIPRTQRESVLSRIAPVMTEAENEPTSEREIIDIKSRRKVLSVNPFILGLLTSIIGTIVAGFPFLTSVIARKDIIITAGASILIILTIMVYYKIKEQDVSSKAKEIESYMNFENEVSHIIEKLGKYKIAVGDSNAPYDFAITSNGHKIIIEVKSWERRIPAQILGRLVERLKQTVTQYGAKEAIIVTPTSLYPAGRLQPDEHIKIMSLKEFRNYLAHSV